MEFNNNNDYKVGYQHPPIETRFKKGTSGNRNGRPKGRKNFNTKLKYFLDGKISITNAGESIEFSKGDAILLQLTNNAPPHWSVTLFIKIGYTTTMNYQTRWTEYFYLGTLPAKSVQIMLFQRVAL